MEAKWPRTYHLPFSPGLQNDDRRLPSTSVFEGRRVIATEKYDGEGATMTPERTYPRSPDGRYHPSRDVMKAYHATKAAMIPAGWRISGEYMYARHSIEYTRANGNALPAWFIGFGVWNEDNVLLPWDETIEVFEMLDISAPKVLHDGIWDEGTIESIARNLDTQRQEGLVVRIADAIPYPSGKGDKGRFFQHVSKWVRKDHVATDEHWAFRWRDEPEWRNEIT